MKRKLQPLLFASLFAFSAVTLSAQPGSLDKKFGDDGFVLSSAGNSTNNLGYDVVVQPDGKTVISGKSQVSSSLQAAILMRYKLNGDPDSSFGRNGVVAQSFTNQFDNFSVLKIQQDGKFIVAGLSIRHDTNFVLFARYNADGTIDNSFRTKTTAIKYYGFGAVATDIAIQPDNKILLQINNNQPITFLAQTQVERYNEDGTIDRSFGNNGNFTYTGNFWFTKFTTDRFGRIICMSGDAGLTNLLRLLPNGRPDKTFGINGLATKQVSPYDGTQNIIAQPDGKIIICGFLQASNFVDVLFSVYRFDANGTLDSTFNGTGINSTKINGLDYPYDVALQPDGKLVATGYTISHNGPTYMTLMRYNTRNGHTDSTFGNNGLDTVTTTWDGKSYSYGVACAVSDDGARIVVTGQQGGKSFLRNDFLTARFIARGATPLLATAASTNDLEIYKAGVASVYPNPVKNIATISFSLPESTNVRVSIANMQGQVLSTIYNGYLNKGNQTMQANVSNLASGTYNVLIQAGGRSSYIKLVKL